MPDKEAKESRTLNGDFDRAGDHLPLPGPMRKRAEDILGTEIGDVRLHPGREAADSAARQRAKAFTVGSDIYFGKGYYDPESDSGRALIFHELAHVIQQKIAAAQSGARDVPGVSTESEQEAREVSNVLTGKRSASTPVGISPTRVEVARDEVSTLEPEQVSSQAPEDMLAPTANSSSADPDNPAPEAVSTEAHAAAPAVPEPPLAIPFEVTNRDPTVFFVPLMASPAQIAARFTGDASLTESFENLVIGSARGIRIRNYKLLVPEAYAVLRAALDRQLEKDLDWLVTELSNLLRMSSGDVTEMVEKWSGYAGITDASDTSYLLKFLDALHRRQILGRVSARDWMLARIPSLGRYLAISIGAEAADIVSGSSRYLHPTANPRSLGVSINATQLPDEELLVEMREIRRWFDTQTESTDESLLMERQLETMQDELRRRRLRPPEPSRGRHKRARRPIQEITAPASAVSNFDLTQLSIEELDQELLDLEEWTALTGGSSTAETSRQQIEAEIRDRLSPRYNLTLGLKPDEMQSWKNIRTEEARKMLTAFRASVRIELDSGIYRLELRYKLRDEFPVVSRISDFFGGTSIPSRSIWDGPKNDFEFADKALAEDNILTAANYFQTAATETHFNVRRIIDYANASESGAGTAVNGLKVVKTGAAITVTVIAPYGVFVGAAYTATQDTLQQAVEVHLGLRDKIDWGGIAFDAAINIVAGKLGGQLGGKIYSRLIARGLGETVAGKMATTIVSDLAAGRVSSTVATSGRAAFDALRGRDVTWDQYLDAIADQWTDPTQYAMDIGMGHAQRKAQTARAAEIERRQSFPQSRGLLTNLSQGTKSQILGAAMRGFVEAVPSTGRMAADVNIAAPTPALIEPAPFVERTLPYNPAEMPDLVQAPAAGTTDAARAPDIGTQAATAHTEAPAVSTQAETSAATEAPPVTTEADTSAATEAPPVTTQADTSVETEAPTVSTQAGTSVVTEAAAPSTNPALDRAVDGFMSTFDTALDPAATVPTTPTAPVIAPEVAAGVDPAHVRPLGQLTGRNFTDSQIADIGRLWDSVANPGQAQTLNRANSRRFFDNQRNRFWRAMRDPRNPLGQRVRDILRGAGINTDDGGSANSNAPYYTLANGRRITMSIDHAVERQQDPTRALDSANLRFSFLRENTVVLRILNELDPMRPPRPPRPWRWRWRRRRR